MTVSCQVRPDHQSQPPTTRNTSREITSSILFDSQESTEPLHGAIVISVQSSDVTVLKTCSGVEDIGPYRGLLQPHTNMKLTSSYQDFLGHHRRRSAGYVASETVCAFEHRCRLLRGMFPATIRSHFCYFCFWPIKIRSELISDACSALVEHLKRWPSSNGTQHISDADGKKERSD